MHDSSASNGVVEELTGVNDAVWKRVDTRSIHVTLAPLSFVKASMDELGSSSSMGDSIW